MNQKVKENKLEVYLNKQGITPDKSKLGTQK